MNYKNKKYENDNIDKEYNFYLPLNIYLKYKKKSDEELINDYNKWDSCVTNDKYKKIIASDNPNKYNISICKINTKNAKNKQTDTRNSTNNINSYKRKNNLYIYKNLNFNINI